MRLSYIRQLLNGAISKEQTMANYLSEKENLFHERLGGKVESNELLLMSILCNLTAEYRNVVTPLLCQEGVELEKVKQTLVEHANGLKSNSETDTFSLVAQEVKSQVHAALAAQTWVNSGKGYGKNQFRFGKGSWGGGSSSSHNSGGKGGKGHPGKGKNIGKGGGVRKEGEKPVRKCWICGSEKHQKAQCPSKKK